MSEELQLTHHSTVHPQQSPKKFWIMDLSRRLRFTQLDIGLLLGKASPHTIYTLWILVTQNRTELIIKALFVQQEDFVLPRFVFPQARGILHSSPSLEIGVLSIEDFLFF